MNVAGRHPEWTVQRAVPGGTVGPGVRIEDIVTVTEDGGRRLNNPGRELRTVH